MKSYLTGSPQLHLALNDQLVIAGGGHAGYGMVELDNVNFHECVDLGKFEAERMLVLEPPHGEFVLMNFHIGSLRHEGQIPFRVTPMLSAISEYKQELRLQIRAEFADKYHGANVRVTFTVPKSSTGATVDLAPGAKQQAWEYDDATKTVTWTIRKFPGGSTQAISCKFVVKSEVNVHKEVSANAAHTHHAAAPWLPPDVRLLRAFRRWVRYLLPSRSQCTTSPSCRCSISRSSSETSRTTRTGGSAASRTPRATSAASARNIGHALARPQSCGRLNGDADPAVRDGSTRGENGQLSIQSVGARIAEKLVIPSRMALRIGTTHKKVSLTHTSHTTEARSGASTVSVPFRLFRSGARAPTRRRACSRSESSADRTVRWAHSTLTAA